MGALGWALKLSPEQERKFLENVQKFAEDMDPEQVKKDIMGYAKKVDALVDTTVKMYDLVGTLAMYTKAKDPEGWEKAKEGYAQLKAKAAEEAKAAKRAWRGA